jgi:hypothetical protein
MVKRLVTRRGDWVLAFLSAGLLLTAGTSMAHHSFAMFEQREVIISGTVKEYLYTNPHIQIRLIVESASDANPVSYLLEGPSPVILKRLGWSRSTVNEGDKLKVSMHPLKDGTPGGQLVKVWLPDGKEMSLIAEDVKYK